MRNRMTVKVLVAAAIGAAAVAAGVPAVYGVTGTLANNNNTYPITPTANGLTIDATVANAWVGGVIPGAAGDTMNLTYDTNPFLAASANQNILLAANTTLGTLNVQVDGGRYAGPRMTVAGGLLIFDNGGAGATINESPNSRGSMTISSNIQLLDNLTIRANGGPSIGFQNALIDSTSTAGKNLTIEGGGVVTFYNPSGTDLSPYTNNQIHLNHGIITNQLTTGNVGGTTNSNEFGSGASAGLWISQGGSFYEGQQTTTITYNAPIHLAGTGDRLDGTLNFMDNLGSGGSVVLEGDAWWAASQGTYNSPISESGGSRKLTISYSANPYRTSFNFGQHGEAFDGVNTYTGGTEIQPFAAMVIGTSIASVGSVLRNVTVDGGGQVGLYRVGNLADAPGQGGLNTGQVNLRPGYLHFDVGSNDQGFQNPNGDFTTAGGVLRLLADFDPTPLLNTGNTGSGGVVALSTANSQSFDTASWGDGTFYFGTQANTTGGNTSNTPILYTGTISAGAGANMLNLGYTGSIGGNSRATHSYAPLEFDSVIAAGNVAGVNVKAGFVNYNNTMTYAGPTNVNYDGTLQILASGVISASTVTVNAAGTLNLPFAGGAINTAVTIKGGGTATLGQTAGLFPGGTLAGGATVAGFDPSSLAAANPANGAAMPYRGLVNYNYSGSVAAAPGLTINKYGEVILNANVVPTAGTDSFIVNDLGVIRAIPGQFDAMVGTAALTINPGAVLYNGTPGAASILPASFATLPNTNNIYYGIGNGANNAGIDWTIGDASNTPWKGLAGGADGADRTDNVTDATAHHITLNGNAALIGLANNLGGSTNYGLGSGNTVGGNNLRVNSIISGGNGISTLTIAGGGSVALNNNSNNFTAPIVIDATQLTADLGAADSYLGDVNNTITLKNGGKLYIGDTATAYTLPATRTVTVGTGGGALGVGGSAAAPLEVTIGNASQLTGLTKFTKYGVGTLKLTAATGLSGPVSVVGGTLQPATANALASATSVTVGIAQAALVSPFLSVNSTAYPVLNGVNGDFGALLLDPAITYTGQLNNLAGVTFNGGAIGFTGTATLNMANIHYGAQTVVSGLNVLPMASSDLDRYNGVTYNPAQQVKILHLGGYSPNVAGTLTLTGAIANDGGTPVVLMKSGHNMTLDLSAGGANTYTGGTYIFDGEVKVNNNTQLGAGAIELTGTYSTNAAASEGILHITDNVTFSAAQFFRFSGNNSNAGTTINGNTTYYPYVSVDAGKTATISALEDSLTSGGQINANGLGTLKLTVAQNLTVRNGMSYGLYIKGGTVETDSLPYSGSTRNLILENGTLTVHAPPAAANYGDVMNTTISGTSTTAYGFSRLYVRDQTTNTVNVDSGTLFRVTNQGAGNWDGTMIVNGADSTAEALFTVANSAVVGSLNGVLDIHGGRVAIINDNNLGGRVVPVDNANFTLKLRGGEYDGNDFQATNNRNTTLGLDNTNNAFIKATMVINSDFSTPTIGGAFPTTLVGNKDTTWTGSLIKNGSGILTFNRNGGTFSSDATTALTINGGQVVIDGYGAFDSATFQANHVPIINNSLTDTGADAGVVFANTTGDLANDIRWAASITGSGGIQVNGVILHLGASPSNVDAGLLRLTTDTVSGLGGRLRLDGDNTIADPFNPANAGDVTLHANVSTALGVSAASTLMARNVTLANTSTGGSLDGTLVARSLTISGASGSFSENAGSTLNLNGVTAIVNNGTFTYNGGTTNATAINSTTPTGQLVLNANLALNEVRQSVKVQVNSGSVLTLTASGGPTTGGTDANVSRMGSLVLSGAADAWTSKLDVNDNKVIIDNANSAVAAATYTQTNNQLKQGFDNGAWDGQGIVSTKAQTNVNNGVPVTIGVINNDDGSGNPAFFHDGTDLPQFGGQNVNGTAVLTKYTYFGDADLSGTVDAVDYTFFVAGVQSGGTLTGWEWGDFDYSGTIDAVDYTFFVFGVQGQGAALAGGGSGPTSVPEPASLALLGLGGLLMLKRRNRKS